MLATTGSPDSISTAAITLRRCNQALPLARVVYEHLSAVTIEYGRVVCGRFIASESEYLPMLQHPELYGMYDGQTWDIDALHALVSPAMTDDDEADSEVRA